MDQRKQKNEIVCLQSYYINNNKQTNNELIVSQAMLSSGLIKKQDKIIILYTNKPDLFKKCNYDDIIYLSYNDLRDYSYNLVDTFWSATKLVSSAIFNIPHFHLDIDLFLFNSNIFPCTNLKSDFYTLYNEDWLQFYIEHILSTNNILIPSINKQLKVFNFSLYGSTDYDISKFDMCLHKTITFFKEQNDIFKQIFRTFNNKWIKSVFMEQIVFPYFLKQVADFDIKPIIDIDMPKLNKQDLDFVLKKNGVMHLGDKKDHNKQESLIHIISYLHKKYLKSTT